MEGSQAMEVVTAAESEEGILVVAMGKVEAAKARAGQWR